MAWYSQYDAEYGALNAQRDAAIRAAQSGNLSPSARGMTDTIVRNIENQMRDVVSRRDAEAAQIRAAQASPAAQQRTSTPAPDPFQQQLTENRRQLGLNLSAYFQSVGLGNIAAWANQAAKDGYTEEWIRLNVRNREEYKQRFPAMQHYSYNKLGFTEQDYINYEQTARNLDQQYGLPDNLIYNAVTDLLINEVDAEELAERAAMAGAAAVQAPEDFKATMRDYYGIDDGGLAAYFLDPDNAEASLRKQSAASLAGTIAARQNIPNLPKALAEDLYDRGVRTEQEMLEGFGTASQLRGLSTGKANTVSQEQLIRGSFGDSAAEEAVARVSKIRRASQRGGGSYVSGESGASGLGSASY